MQQQEHAIICRARKCATDQARMRELIRHAYEYILPGMPHDLDEQASNDAADRPAVLDSTAADAAKAYAGRFLTRYMPPHEQFIDLVPGIEFKIQAPALMEQAQQLLGRSAEMLHQLLEMSDFYQAASRSLLDYAISAGAINFSETDSPGNPFAFEAVPLPQLMVEAGPHGAARTSYRWFHVAPANIPATWPDARLPDDLAKAADGKGGYDARCRLLEALVWQPDTGRYDYLVIHEKSGAELVRRTVGEGARLVFRNMLPSTGTLGFGPGLMQLPNIRQLNHALTMRSMHDDLAAQAAYQAPNDHPWFADGGNLQLDPGIVVPFSRSGPIVPFPIPASVTLQDRGIEELRAAIRKGFLSDDLPDPAGPVRSPTEFATRERRGIEQFEPETMRLFRELVAPLVRRGIEIMQRRGIIPPFRIDGLRVKIDVAGPLAQLRKQNDARARLGWAAEVAQALGAEVFYGATDVEAFAADLLERGGIEPEFVLNAEERQARQAQQQAMMLAQAEAGGQA